MKMYDTPDKGTIGKTSSLREKIESKLMTEKKLLNTKQNIFKTYLSHTKNAPQTTIYPNLTKEDSQGRKRQIQTRKQKFCSVSPSQYNFCQPPITQNNILEFESLQNRNFYGFDQWLEFNNKFFPHVNPQCVKNLWKIMRTINYGDVLIPSGLIYEVSKVLTPKKKEDSTSLKSVFNQFLKFNHAADQVNNFRELQNYPSFQQIERIYFSTRPKQKNSSTKKAKQYSSLKKLSQHKNVFQRVYNESKYRIERKTKVIYKGLIEKQINEQCVFKPKINQYCPQKLFIDETLRPSRAYQKQRWNTERIGLDDLIERRQFKAKPFQRSKFENKSLDNIPGVAEYIDRKKNSQLERRKLQRYQQKPTLVYRHN